jgi:anthranilate synthase component 1
MTEQEFSALAARGFNRIPVTLELLADVDTALSVYLKLGNLPYSYLLESVVGGERFGRYSFIGLPAKKRIRVVGRSITLEDDNGVIEQVEGDPLAYIEQYQAQFRAAPKDGLPRFCGGLVGYFGYETIRYIERKLDKADKPDAIGAPDILLLQSEELAVVDNLSGKLYLVVYADPAEQGAFAKAQQRLQELRGKLRQPVQMPYQYRTEKTEAKSEFGEMAFKAAVEKTKQYIYNGDCMQVVIAQRMSQRFDANPISLYRALRTLNPSPYMFYYDFGDFHVVGASPEILVRRENETVTVRPIAGTRPRGKTREQDLALAEELLTDPKEIAEHVMLIDLGRNDVGRVSQTGSVKLTDKMVIERYSHVMHIVSNVDATLKPNMSNMDILRATFPAGTVSGSPKVRAMQIIDELEPSKRGVYSGAVGYLGFNGDMDVAIALRTAVIKDKTLYVQAGAGIVADSVPQSEWEETLNKARAVIRAAQMVQDGLDAE